MAAKLLIYHMDEARTQALEGLCVAQAHVPAVDLLRPQAQMAGACDDHLVRVEHLGQREPVLSAGNIQRPTRAQQVGTRDAR